MARDVVIEEFHVTLLVPRRISTRESAAIRRTLRRPAFVRKLRVAALEVVTGYAALNTVTVNISR